MPSISIYHHSIQSVEGHQRKALLIELLIHLSAYSIIQFNQSMEARVAVEEPTNWPEAIANYRLPTPVKLLVYNYRVSTFVLVYL